MLPTSLSAPPHSLKRARPPTGNDESPLTSTTTAPSPSLGRPYPSLPNLNDLDYILEVFTHPSFLLGRPHEEAGRLDYTRLADLGAKALEASVTLYLFKRRPLLDFSAIMHERQRLISYENLDEWVRSYGLRDKLRLHPSVYSVLTTYEETHSLFCAYAGAVFAERGHDALNEWIHNLITVSNHANASTTHGFGFGDRVVQEVDSVRSTPMSSPLSSEREPQTPSPKSKRIKNEDSPAEIFFGSQPPPNYTPNSVARADSRRAASSPNPLWSYQQPLGVEKSYTGAIQFSTPAYSTQSPTANQHGYGGYGAAQLTSSPYPSYPSREHNETHNLRQSNPQSYSTSSSPMVAFLPLFNQTASQRKVSVQYMEEFTGPPHARIWTMKCLVNGVLKGHGTGVSKQVAKEEAAKQAYYAMGWAAVF